MYENRVNMSQFQNVFWNSIFFYLFIYLFFGILYSFKLMVQDFLSLEHL